MFSFSHIEYYGLCSFTHFCQKKTCRQFHVIKEAHLLIILNFNYVRIASVAITQFVYMWINAQCKMTKKTKEKKRKKETTYVDLYKVCVTVCTSVRIVCSFVCLCVRTCARVKENRHNVANKVTLPEMKNVYSLMSCRFNKSLFGQVPPLVSPFLKLQTMGKHGK